MTLLPEITLLAPARAQTLKMPFVTRRVPRGVMATLLGGERQPRPGDLVLVRVERLGQHRHLELVSGRRSRLFAGDEVVLAYGHRYAPDQFEAEVPDHLGPCHMVAAGGIASCMLSRHGRVRAATQVQPLGLIGDRQGQVINLADHALPAPPAVRRRPFTVAVLGTSMNAGKTETVSHLVRGLAASGLRVGAAKVTGTGSGGDVWSMTDAGARQVLDFTDAGMASTYLADTAQLAAAQQRLIDTLAAQGNDAVVFEVADGLLQRETGLLASSPAFADMVDAVVFAAGDAMGAAMGVGWLRQRGLPVRAASGLMTASPLAAREAAAATGLPVLDLAALSDVGVADVLGWVAVPNQAGVAG
ncbi:MAG: DUF1611 domain-containing protein [Burkholderiaceae bacterium]|nr:DUF1611 domain-containing protein [Rhodoferax sp.]MCP5285084.1 DUF1611 domain-containing protein [Burkholderiaceae bacterium]